MSASSSLIALTCATAALLNGCASTPQDSLAKYQPPPVGAPAAVINAGHGHAWSVDGTETPSFAKTVAVTPGEHRVGVNCLTYQVMGLYVGPTIAAADIAYGAQFALVTGSFEQGKTYYVRCVTVNGQPNVGMSDAPDGSELPPGFKSICTRSCPP